MPGASLVAAVVAPDILDAIPGDKEVFFGMLHLECGTTCTKADGIWLIQGQWTQVNDAVALLDIVERTKTANESLIVRGFFDQSNENGLSGVIGGVGSKKNVRFQSTFLVEWTGFFNEIKKEFPPGVVDKFMRIVTAAVRKEEEAKRANQTTGVTRARRPLTRRKGLPHRLKPTVVENPLTAALAIAFGAAERDDSAENNIDEDGNEDALSVDSVDSVDVQMALEENADEEYSVRPKGKRKAKSKKKQGNASHLLGSSITPRNGKAKVSRVGKRSMQSLNKILRNLNAEVIPVDPPVSVDDGRQDRCDDFLFAPMVFPSRSDEDQQVVQQHQQLTIAVYRCPICSTFTSDSKGGIKIHAFQTHLTTSFRCFVCKGDFSSRRALERHRVSHRRETFPFLKCLCSRIMTSRSGLTRHIDCCKALMIGARLMDDPTAADVLVADPNPNKKKTGRQKQLEQLNCDICNNFSATSGPKLVHHKLVEHAESALKCASCPSLTFDNFYSFYEHNTQHLTRLPCETCGKVFSNPRTYEAHLRTHDRDFEKAAFVCTICAKAFSTAYVLKYHVQHVHMNMGKRFQCSRCGRGFTQKIHLIEHLYSHDGLKPYICDQCGKGFSHQTSLQQHKLIHGNEQHYKCEECPKSFHTRASLLMHKNCHTERKHQCQYCGKLFTQKTARIRHERIHTGEQPFKCDACSKAFSDSSVLRRHMLTHDPNHSPKRQAAAAAKKTAATSGALLEKQTADGPLALQTRPRHRASCARARNRSTAGQNVGMSAAPSMLPYPSSSALGLCQQPQPSIDSALDLHLFSPMSVLVQQPLNMHNSSGGTNMGHHGLSMNGLGMANESCMSPETPPPISVPDQHATDESNLRLYHSHHHHQQQQQHAADIYQQQSQRAHDNHHHHQQQQQSNQQYHIIQIPPDAVSIVQMAGPSNSNRTTSKFSSYMQHAMVADSNRPPSADNNLQQALLCSANQAGSLGQSTQTLYLAPSTSPSSSVVEHGATSSNPVVIQTSNLPFSQPFFLSSEQLGNNTTLFAVPAEAFFSLQGNHQPDSPQQPACSYQYSDMPLTLGSPSVNVQDNTDHHHQQQATVSDQILYQSVPAFFTTMDGIPVSSLNLFSEPGRQLTADTMVQPLLQMPPPITRPQNAHQRVSSHYN